MTRVKRYLGIPNSDLQREPMHTLKKLDEREAIQAFVEILSKHLYRTSFDAGIAHLNYLTGREDLENTDNIPERIEIIKDLEQWWERNKNRSQTEWFADLLLHGRTEARIKIGVIRPFL